MHERVKADTKLMGYH